MARRTRRPKAQPEPWTCTSCGWIHWPNENGRLVNKCANCNRQRGAPAVNVAFFAYRSTHRAAHSREPGASGNVMTYNDGTPYG